MADAGKEHAPYGHCFAAEEYLSQDSFERDRALLATQWCCVAHVRDFPQVGSYRVRELCGESLIVARTESGFAAFANVCRHRGSRICMEASGVAAAFVCPYHGWTYDRDGGLLSAHGINFPIDRATLGLHRFAVSVHEGLLYVAMDAARAAAFADIKRVLDPVLAFHGLEDACEGATLNYPFRANWKLVVENFLECFHCYPNHPELCSVYSHPKYTAQLDASKARDFLAEVGEWERAARGLGHPVGGVRTLNAEAPQFCVAFRMPIRRGFSTLSRNGAPLAPLMGQFTQYDGGETFGYVGPLFHFSLANDHAIYIRIAPREPALTDVEVTWMVRSGARADIDYRVQDITWLWDATVRQDRIAVERAFEGVRSRYFVPGPYSELEAESSKFMHWHRAHCGTGRARP